MGMAETDIMHVILRCHSLLQEFTAYPLKTNTRIDALVPWNPAFYDESPMYAPIRELAAFFRGNASWPGLSDYRQLLADYHPVTTLNGQPLSIVEQAGKPANFYEHYAPRVYYTGELQTRTENWHDFFQFLTWLVFPKTKAVLNAIHIPLARERIEQADSSRSESLGRRNPVENMLSLFDEGGVVILSSDASLLDHVRGFEWKKLFWDRRDALAGNFRCVTFGHAMYEKGLRPYIGMTANAVLLQVDQAVIEMAMDAQLQWIDEELARIFSEGMLYQKPKDLNPFPVLGMPGWLPVNAEEAFYDDVGYFRPGRRAV